MIFARQLHLVMPQKMSPTQIHLLIMTLPFMKEENIIIQEIQLYALKALLIKE